MMLTASRGNLWTNFLPTGSTSIASVPLSRGEQSIRSRGWLRGFTRSSRRRYCSYNTCLRRLGSVSLRATFEKMERVWFAGLSKEGAFRKISNSRSAKLQARMSSIMVAKNLDMLTLSRRSPIRRAGLVDGEMRQNEPREMNGDWPGASPATEFIGTSSASRRAFGAGIMLLVQAIVNCLSFLVLISWSRRLPRHREVGDL